MLTGHNNGFQLSGPDGRGKQDTYDNKEEKVLIFNIFPVRWRDFFINGELTKHDDSMIHKMIAFMKYQSTKEKSIEVSQTKKKRQDNPNSRESQGGGINKRNDGHYY